MNDGANYTFKKIPSQEEDESLNPVLQKEAMRISLDELQSQIQGICSEITFVDAKIEEETKEQTVLQELLESQQNILNLLLEEKKKTEYIPKPHQPSKGSIKKLKSLQEQYVHEQSENTSKSISSAKVLPSYRDIVRRRQCALDQFDHSLQQARVLQARRQSLLSRFGRLLASDRELSDVNFLSKSFENLTNDVSQLQQKLSHRQSQEERLSKLEAALQLADEELSSMELIREEVEAKEQEIREIRAHWPDGVFSHDAPLRRDEAVQTKSPRTLFAGEEEIKKEIGKRAKKVSEIKASQAHENQVLLNSLKSWELQIGVLEREMRMTIEYFEQLGKEFSAT